MYAYLVETAQDRRALAPRRASRSCSELSQAYHGPWNEIRARSRATASRVNYTWFTQHVVHDAWNRGRVVIIGEAAHSCPPTLAQGAAQALEDALVLAELLLERDAVDQELWDEFHARRLPRATRGRRGIRAARPVADRPRAGRRRPGPDAPASRARERAGMSAA